MKQLFFYLSNLDTIRFIEYGKVVEFLRDVSPAKVILDLGSGYSVLPEVLQPQAARQYICLDLSPGATRYQANPGKHISPIRANMCHLPFRTGSIPVILAVSSIEHVPDDIAVFREIRRILPKGGTAIISIDYSAGEVKIARPIRPQLLIQMLYRFKGLWQAILGQTHLNYFLEQTSVDCTIKHYNEAEIHKCLAENDLQVVDKYFYNKGVLQGFHRIFPFGWFVLKDLTVGLLLGRYEDAFVKVKDSAIIMMKIRAI